MKTPTTEQRNAAFKGAPFPDPMPNELLDAYYNDALLHQCVKRGLSMEQTILEFVKIRAKLFDQIRDLENKVTRFTIPKP